MRLKKTQQEAVLAWITEGLQSDEINARAAVFVPPFSVSRSQVDYYRKKYAVDIQELRSSGKHDALNSGLALASERVRVLQRVAHRLIIDLLPEEDLSGKRENSYLWTDQVKGIGNGDNYERVEYEEFNKAEVDALRGVLEDIAKEVGGRVQKTEHSGPDGTPIPVETILPFDLSALDDEEFELFKSLYRKARSSTDHGAGSGDLAPGE